MKPAAWHQHVARLLHATRGNRRAVAAATSRTVEQIDAICERPAVAEYRKQLAASAVVLKCAAYAQFDAMLARALNAVEAILDDEHAPADVKLRAATTVLDRHPSGLFQKRSRTSAPVPGPRSFDSHVIEEIKRDALTDTEGGHHAE